MMINFTLVGRCLLFSLPMLLGLTHLQSQSVGAGTLTPHPSAILDISSTQRGFLMPRLTESQMDAIFLPPTGLMLYNTTTKRFRFNIGTPEFPVFYGVDTVSASNTSIHTWNLSGNNNNQNIPYKIGTISATSLDIRSNNETLGFLAANNHTVAIGRSAAQVNTGTANVALGRSALSFNTVGSGMAAIGAYALVQYNDKIEFPHNTAVGADALNLCATCQFNTAIGYKALEKSNASFNTAAGSFALQNATTGSQNSAAGYQALQGVTSGSSNVALGHEAGKTITTGNNNTFLGKGANVQGNQPTLTNTTAIGEGALVSTSHTMVFGSLTVNQHSFGVPGKYYSSVDQAITVGSTFANGNGAYLSIGGDWTNTSDVHKKNSFIPINNQELQKALLQLPITQWRYKGHDDLHIGPMAQDFKALFKLGEDDITISTVDAFGVALAAIKMLQDMNTDLRERIERLVTP